MAEEKIAWRARMMAMGQSLLDVQLFEVLEGSEAATGRYFLSTPNIHKHLSRVARYVIGSRRLDANQPWQRGMFIAPVDASPPVPLPVQLPADFE